MSNTMPILKDELREHPVPTQWRTTIRLIVDSLLASELPRIAGVMTMPQDVFAQVKSNIESYGVNLVPLPEETWSTSVSQWILDYWDVLVDLYSVEEGRSDLVLSLRVYKIDGSFEMEIKSVHVP